MSPDDLSHALLNWYAHSRRDLPWRAQPQTLADPYVVWLSEVMLQQTTVTAVIPYFHTFLQRWPTVEALAAAPLDDLLAAWAGLGYYARARNLHACAKAVAAAGGQFPASEDGLRTLPGIGAYTAAAIAAIAFGHRAVVMDGNVERVMARLFAVRDPLPGVKPRLKALADGLTPDHHSGDYAQAVMDLGATVCTPRSPACVICPWSAPCQARALGIADQLPAKTAKPPKPIRHGMVFFISDRHGNVLLRRRPERGLLGGMAEFPSTPWRDDGPWMWEDARSHCPVPASAPTIVPGDVRHTFTHFHLILTVARLVCDGTPPPESWWQSPHALHDQALPTLMRKVARMASLDQFH